MPMRGFTTVRDVGGAADATAVFHSPRQARFAGVFS